MDTLKQADSVLGKWKSPVMTSLTSAERQTIESTIQKGEWIKIIEEAKKSHVKLMSEIESFDNESPRNV